MCNRCNKHNRCNCNCNCDRTENIPKIALRGPGCARCPSPCDCPCRDNIGCNDLLDIIDRRCDNTAGAEYECNSYVSGPCRTRCNDTCGRRSCRCPWSNLTTPTTVPR